MAQTCLTVLVLAALACSGLATTLSYSFCGCTITTTNSSVPSQCPSSPQAPVGTCDNSLLYDSGCKLMCRADLTTSVGKATSLYAKVSLNQKAFDFIGCNNGTLVNSTGGVLAATLANCHINTPTDQCPTVSYESSCPAGYNCGNYFSRWNDVGGNDVLTCSQGALAVRISNGTWMYNQKPSCSNVKTWTNSTILSGSTGYWPYPAPITVSCVASKTVVQCTYPPTKLTSSIATSFFTSNRVDSTQLIYTNTSLLNGMRVSCNTGYQLAAFSVSKPTSADLLFSANATLNCASGASWVNSLTGSFPSDGQMTCVVPLAYCNCSYNSFSSSVVPGCRNDLLRPIVGVYGCQLGCPDKFRMVGSMTGINALNRLTGFHCASSSSWQGDTCLMHEAFSTPASPFATCEPDPLWGCPSALNTFHCPFCEMSYLTWSAATSSLTCSQGVLVGLSTSTYSFSSLSWFWNIRYTGGAWFGFDFYTGWKISVGVPLFACWTGDYEPSPIVHTNATDSCASCGFCYFKHNEPDEACVDGTLTLTYSSSSGTICQNTTINAAISLSCTNGVWTLNGNIVDMDTPIERCEGDITEPTTVELLETTPAMAEETTVAEEVATTEAAVETTPGAVQFTCPEEECSGCSWWGFESDPCHQTCVSAVLQLDFGVDFHLCSAGADFDFNLNALFCKNGSWFYLSAQGEVSVDLGENPLTSCEPPAPEPHTCDQTGCESCSFSCFPDFLPNQACYEGILTLDFGFQSGVCFGGEIDINANAIFCENGQWSYLSANGSVSIDLSGTVQTCLPPPCDEITPEEPECSACSYREWHGCGSHHSCSSDGQLQVSFGHHHHICVGGAVINVDALYCDAGNWWYPFGWGHFGFSMFDYSFFQPCYPGPPIQFNCTHSDCDSACSWWGFPWWAPRQSCSSGVLTIDFEFSEVCVFDLDIHVEAIYCKAGRWYSDVDLSIEFTLGENPVDVCTLDMSSVAPEATTIEGSGETTVAAVEETTAAAVEETTAEVEATTGSGCVPVHTCPFEDDNGIAPVSQDCIDDNWSFSCGVEGDIFVWFNGAYERFSHACWLGDFGWFAYDCFGRVKFFQGTLHFRCRLDGEASHEQ